jgi:hypothetical protein
MGKDSSRGTVGSERSTKPGSPLALATAAEERRMGRCIFKVPAEEDLAEEDLESDIGAGLSLDPLRLELERLILYGEGGEK